MEISSQKSSDKEFVNFASPIDSSQKVFLGKKLRISKEAQNTLKRLPSFEQRKLHNNLNRLVAEAINHNQHASKKIYFELPHAFLKLSFDKSHPPYIGTITCAETIKKPESLRPKDPKKSHPFNCGVRSLRGLAKEIVSTPYYSEKILDPNIFTAEQLVDMQVRRFRERLDSLQFSRKVDPKGEGHTNRYWAEVVYGAKPGWFFCVGTGDEVVALTGIFGISAQTGVLSKTYFGATKQSSIKKNLHTYAVIQGFPSLSTSSGSINNIQKQLEDTAPDRENTIRKYVDKTRKYNADIVIYVDSDLNVHKFYRSGHYQFIDCKNSI